MSLSTTVLLFQIQSPVEKSGLIAHPIICIVSIHQSLVQKQVNTINPGFKVNRGFNFSHYNCFQKLIISYMGTQVRDETEGQKYF